MPSTAAWFDCSVSGVGARHSENVVAFAFAPQGQMDRDRPRLRVEMTEAEARALGNELIAGANALLAERIRRAAEGRRSSEEGSNG